MITVMGATGHVGGGITRRLLAAGEPVRAIGRNPEVLAELAAAGAETMSGDAADTAFLTRAFSGADAVHTMLPSGPGAPDFRADQARLGEAITTAVRDARVRKVVVQSSLGADLPGGTGFIGASLYPQEQRLRALPDVDLLILRPTLFFESICEGLAFVDAIGVNADVVDPDVPLPMIATCDIADVAAAALRARDWAGAQVRELLGPEDLTFAEATRILGAAVGRPDLGYVRLPGEEMAGALVQAGFSPDTAALHVEMGHALSAGTITHAARTEQNTTPTRFADVVSELVSGRRASVEGQARGGGHPGGPAGREDGGE